MIVERLAINLACAGALAAAATSLPATPADAQVASAKPCASLAGTAILPSAIRLPSRGATITAAEQTAVQGRSEVYCKVLGRINPVDAAAPPILFEINLPTAWNGKYLQYGGGGLNGRLVTGLDALRDAPPGEVSPLAQGYVTAGTDGGHPNAKPAIQIFALNDEALINHAYGAYVKTADVAHTVIDTFYHRAPTARYFIGGSEGGREALMFAQRFPTMFDGIVATVPVINWTGIQLATYDHWTLLRAGGWMDSHKIKLWRDTVLQACDARDGKVDGVVADYSACRVMSALRAHRCPDGKDAAGCFSDPQLALIDTIYAPRRYKFALANGERSYPGFLPGGEAQAGGVVPWIIDPQQPAPGDHADGRYAVGDMRFFITHDPDFSAPFDETRFRAQVLRVSGLMDMTDPDLKPFFRRGGKLIIKSNSADFVQSPAAVMRYVADVETHTGAALAGRSMRYFVAPGTTHGGQGLRGDGQPVPDRVSTLTAIDRWVSGGMSGGLSGGASAGMVPQALTLTGYDVTGAARTAWPLCRYPSYPRYVGGDPDHAESYRCRVTASSARVAAR